MVNVQITLSFQYWHRLMWLKRGGNQMRMTSTQPTPSDDNVARSKNAL